MLEALEDLIITWVCRATCTGRVFSLFVFLVKAHCWIARNWAMAYVVLARRWRPQTFQEVVGQSHVTRTLQNAIRQERIAHAYLFSGPRGVGKTTVARILAKALNCESGPTAEPCGSCTSCREVAQGISMDVQEIDGASHTSVENIRDIREGLRYRPSRGRFRVYIIDEVHMLSTQAFNALLKTLEEPPAHVVFMFATTEVHKIPATILSRCQRFDFRRISLKEIVSHLQRICAAEGIEASTEVLATVAREAQGSLRDAQSLLDQLVAYAGQRIEPSAVMDVLGVLDRRWLYRTSETLINRDPRGCFSVVEELFDLGHSLQHFYYELVEHVRNLLVAKVTPEVSGILPLADHEVVALKEQADKLSAEDLQVWFDILAKAEEEIRRSAFPRYVLEMLLVRMATLEHVADMEELLEELAKLSSGFQASPNASSGPGQGSSGRESWEKLQSPSREINEETWGAFLEHVRALKPALASVLEQASFMECSQGDMVRLGFPSRFHMDRVSQGEQTRTLEQFCMEFFGRKLKVVAVLDAQPQCRENHLRQQRMAELEARNHPMVQKAIELLGAKVVEVRQASGPNKELSQ